MDEFDITLYVDGRDYRVGIDRKDPKWTETEYFYREAVKRLQRYLTLYRQHFAQSITEIDLLSMVAIHLAREVELLMKNNDAEDYAHAIRELTDKVDDYLKE
jgi:hypothetical protein